MTLEYPGGEKPLHDKQNRYFWRLKYQSLIMQHKPALLILAAGMGSRYGGMKQLDRLGPGGETIMDYSVYDAIQAGFGKVVFVIRKSFEHAFRKQVTSRIADNISCALAFQELDDLPGEFACPKNRTKPWGTGHAIWVAEKYIQEPFAVINADDFYGQKAMRAMANHLSALSADQEGEYAMCAYRLEHTLSNNGQVSRGVCQVDAAGMLKNVTEYPAIEMDVAGQILSEGTPATLPADSMVSMNFWGFNTDIFVHLEDKLKVFLAAYQHDEKKEFYIPMVVDQLIKAGKAKVKVLPAHSQWFGVTYPEDKNEAQQTLNKLIKQGMYPKSLWQ